MTDIDIVELARQLGKGCSDGYCILREPTGGQHTNGGCSCFGQRSYRAKAIAAHAAYIAPLVSECDRLRREVAALQIEVEAERLKAKWALDVKVEFGDQLYLARKEMAAMHGVVALVQEFSEGRPDYGEITAPAARAALLESMFHQMRGQARAALKALAEARRT